MTLTRSEGPADLDDVSTTFEGDIREFVRRDFAPLRRLHPETGEFAVNNINSLVQPVAVASLQESETLMLELQKLRNFLESEGERVQRELTGYAQLNQAAMKSTQMITETLAQWKTTLAPTE